MQRVQTICENTTGGKRMERVEKKEEEDEGFNRLEMGLLRLLPLC